MSETRTMNLAVYGIRLVSMFSLFAAYLMANEGNALKTAVLLGTSIVFALHANGLEASIPPQGSDE